MAIARALRILAQRKLDAGHGPFENDVVRILAPAQLDHCTLAADRVGAAVQDIGGRDAARQRAVNGDIFGVQYVFDPHHRRDRNRAFIDAVGRDMGVAVDDARHHVLAGAIYDLRSGRHHYLLASFDDLAVANHHGPGEVPLVTVSTVAF